MPRPNRFDDVVGSGGVMKCPECREPVANPDAGYCPLCMALFPPPDARILGELDELDTPAVIEGEGFDGDGRINKFVYYTSSKSVAPTAIPVVANLDVTLPNTKKETLAMSFIDGKRTVGQIERESELPRDELAVALLNLR